MGTSQSSGGPGSGVPLVPPWVPDPPAADQPPHAGEPPHDAGEDQAAAPDALVPDAVLLAPAGRFRGTRRSLGEYAQSGQPGEMRRALGHYIRNGYGGSETAARRMGGTAATAGALHSALSNVAAGRPASPGSPLDPTLLAGRSADEVLNAVLEAVRPIDGTQDAEASRAAIRDALSDLLTLFPEADLLNLSAEQRLFAIERYAAIDVFRRFDLDVGKAIRDKAPSATTALSRLKEVRDYIKEAVAASFRDSRDLGQRVTAGHVSHVVTDALRATFDVFASYAE
jgi:hypothetical protein